LQSPFITGTFFVSGQRQKNESPKFKQSTSMQYSQILNGRFVTIERFSKDHIPALQAIALDTSIWQNLPWKITSETSFNAFMEEIQTANLNGQRVTYVIRNKANDMICGSTGFLNIDAVNRQLEIGATWLSPKVWGTKVNIESKYLLLKDCFEQDIMRAEFRTRESNIRSQKAIEKIGGIREGVLRCHRINEDGSFRNTIVYSIIQPDWPLTKSALEVVVNK